MDTFATQMLDRLATLDIGIVTVGTAILFLICLSALFSGSETALTSASRGKLRSQADNGDRRAASALRVTSDKERLIGAVLLGNNLVNILAASLATSLFTAIFGDAGVFMATLVMTLLILVFAEVLPKTYALANPESAARKVAPLIGGVVTLFFPVVAIIQFLVGKFLALFGVTPIRQNVSDAVQEEIAGTLALGHSLGAVEKDHRDRILGALDLGNRTVEEIMRHRKEIEMIDANEPPETAIEKCIKSSHTRLPVYKGEPENIVGIVHAKDLLKTMMELQAEKPFENRRLKGRLQILDFAMKPYFVPETTTLDDQMRQFLRRHTHFALVVDEYGMLQGLITLEDILEEIVGEIVDEHDEVSDQMMIPTSDGGFIVDGAMPIRDLNRERDWNLPDDNSVTIAGLVIHEAQSIPITGQEFIFHGFRFEVIERESNRIAKLKLRRLDDRPDHAGAATGIDPSAES